MTDTETHNERMRAEGARQRAAALDGLRAAFEALNHSVAIEAGDFGTSVIRKLDGEFVSLDIEVRHKGRSFAKIGEPIVTFYLDRYSPNSRRFPPRKNGFDFANIARACVASVERRRKQRDREDARVEALRDVEPARRAAAQALKALPEVSLAEIRTRDGQHAQITIDCSMDDAILLVERLTNSRTHGGKS